MTAVSQGQTSEALEKTERQSGLGVEDLLHAKVPLSPLKLHISKANNPVIVTGRRTFYKYRDSGITAATGGRVRAMMSTALNQTVPETGWHYHLCEMQIGYFIRGWMDVQFEDGTECRFEAGDMVIIPGGMKHNETGASADFETLGIALPADMGTVACEAPEGWKATKKVA